jgi:malonyl-CoA decarboxylase
VLANFHLSNGAAVYRLNATADTSEKGMRQSYGVMANYHYLLDRLRDNSDAYKRHGRITISNPTTQDFIASLPQYTAKL